MSLSEIKKSAEDRMKKTIEALITGLAKIRTGRATLAFWITLVSSTMDQMSL